MSEATVSFKDLKQQFNEGLLSANQALLLEAFSALEVYALEHSDFDLLGSIYALVVGFFHSHSHMDVFIKYAVRLMNYANTYSELLDYEDCFAIAALLDYELEDYESSKNHVKKEIEIHERNGNKRAIASRLGNIAEIEIVEACYSCALNTALDAKSILSELGLSNDQHGYMNKGILAKCYIELKDYERAESYLTDILNWPELDQAADIKLELYTAFAMYHEKQNKEEASLMYYQEALDLAIDQGFIHQHHELHLKIADAYYKFHQLDKSYKHIKEYLKGSDSSKKNNRAILRQNAELEMKLLHREKELQQIKQEERNFRMSGDFDRLTATYSKSYGINYINQLISISKNTPYDFTLLLMEMPCFKEISKKKGLEATENLLVEFADTLINACARNHQIIRYDLYKFIVIFEHERTDVAIERARKFIQRLQTISYEIKDQLRTLTLHSGIIDNHKDDFEDAEAMIRMASLAVYQSEKIGSNQITIW